MIYLNFCIWYKVEVQFLLHVHIQLLWCNLLKILSFPINFLLIVKNQLTIKVKRFISRLSILFP